MTITPQQVDWLLYNLPTLRAMVDDMEPRVSTSIVELGVSGSKTGNPVEDMAIRRAEISVVLDAVERGIRALDSEERTIYRMKYRANMNREQIKLRVFLSKPTISRRLIRVRAMIAQHVAQIEKQNLIRFWRQIRQHG